MLHIQQFLNTCLCDKESKRRFLNIHENTTWISNQNKLAQILLFMSCIRNYLVNSF